jgi:hypothetical protein
VSYRDVSGNSTNYTHMFNSIVGHMLGGFKVATAIGRSIGRGLDYSMRKAGRGIDGAARQLVSGGRYSRNKGNDLDHLLGTGITFAGIQNSNIGDEINKILGILLPIVTIYISVILVVAGITSIILGGILIFSGIFIFGIPVLVIGLALTSAGAYGIATSISKLPKLPNPQFQ